jgi:hypothetical protein
VKKTHVAWNSRIGRSYPFKINGNSTENRVASVLLKCFGCGEVDGFVELLLGPEPVWLWMFGSGLSF